MKIKSTVLLLLFLSAFSIQAQDDFTQSTLKNILADNQEKVIQLAEAFSEEQYDWRPMEGVNSVGEALMHVAGGNYFLASKMGFPPPEDVDMMKLGKITGKANIIAALEKSNTFVIDKIMLIKTADLKKEVDFGFMKINTLGGLLFLMEHNGEHKGQLIAYARSNGVVPPWSK